MKIVKNKKKNTFLKNYGVKNIFCLPKFQKEKQEKYLKKTGAKNPAQVLEIRKKMVKNAKNSKSKINSIKFESTY